MKNPLPNGDEAVSPVIGVMLMLVVTIIVAAVVSAFATGVTDSSADLPVAAFEFKVYSDYQYASSIGTSSVGTVEAIMKSGEAIDTEDLKIVSYYEDDDGNIVTHEFTRSPDSQGGYSSTGSFRSFSGPGTAIYFGGHASYWHTGDKFTGGSELVLGVTYPEPYDQFEIDVVYEPTNSIIWSDTVTVI